MVDLLYSCHLFFQCVLDVMYRGRHSYCSCINDVSYGSSVCLKSGVIAVVREERRYARCLGIVVVAGVLCHAEILLPVVMNLVEVGPKLLFQHGIYIFL